MIDFFLFCSEGWRRRRRRRRADQKQAARSGASSGPFLTDEDIPMAKRQRMVDQTKEIYDPDEDF